MKLTCQLILGSYLLAATALSVQAEEKMNEQQLSRYYAVIKCLKGYGGDYPDPEDSNQISFVNTMLAYYKLPPYSEEVYNQIKKVDQEAYMDTLMKCIRDEDNMLSKMAAKYNVEHEE